MVLIGQDLEGGPNWFSISRKAAKIWELSF